MPPRPIKRPERIKLSERDSLLLMALLENPPKPNAKLRKAARALDEALTRSASKDPR